MSAPCCIICYELGCCGDNCKSTERALLGQSSSSCLNFFCAPIALTAHSFYSYFFVCLAVYLNRSLRNFFCFLCIQFNYFDCCFKYRDSKFAANAESLGWKDPKGIVWKRAKEVVGRPVLFKDSVEPNDVVQGSLDNCWLMSAFACMAEFPSLVDKVFVNREYSFRGKYKITLYNHHAQKWQVITVDDYFPFKEVDALPGKPKPADDAPKDVVPDKAAEKPTEEVKEGPKVVDEAPKEKEAPPKDIENPPTLEEGKSDTKKVDDLKAEGDDEEKEEQVKEPGVAASNEDGEKIALEKGKELRWACSRPRGAELWVPLLEKAFAKFRGSYGKLAGGNMLWAFNALTGDNVFRLSKIMEGDRKGVWERYILTEGIRPTDTEPISVKTSGHSYKENQLFDLLRTYDRSKALIGASIPAAAPTKEGDKPTTQKLDNGLVTGHAYSLLQVKRVKDFELIQLRNPWGNFEWNGDWSDTSAKWEENPEVANLLHFKKDLNDGMFWMDYQTFAELFQNLDICDRTVNFKDFHLDVHEKPEECVAHNCGPTIGCVQGCFSFWCKCEGIKTLYCGNKSSEYMKKPTKGHDDGIAAAIGM